MSRLLSSFRMPEVYITSANYKKFLDTKGLRTFGDYLRFYDQNQSNPLLVQSIYKNEAPVFLNIFEVKYYKIARSFFINPIELSKIIFHNYSQSIAHQTYLAEHELQIFESKIPKVHSNRKCQLLASDYWNGIIPMMVIEKGSDEIRKFRQAFYSITTSESTFIKGEEEVKEALIAQFPYLMTYEEFKIVYRKNSAPHLLPKSDLEFKLDQLMGKALLWYKDISINNILLRVYDWRPESIKKRFPSFFKELIEFKETIRDPFLELLWSYFNVEGNYDSNRHTQLTTIGFEKCTKCYYE